MQVRIVVMPDGTLSCFIREGPFEEGKQKLAGLMSALGAAGLQFDSVGQIEQHRHDTEHARNEVHDHASH